MYKNNNSTISRTKIGVCNTQLHKSDFFYKKNLKSSDLMHSTYSPKLSRAFSLLEIMFALVAISVVLAALTPVISKNISPTIKQLSTATYLKTNDCASIVNSDCAVCNSFTKECLDCGITSCPSGQTLDTEYCVCMNCAERFISTCTKCTSIECKQCSTGYYLDNKTCKKCPKGSFCPDGKTKITCPEGKYSSSVGSTSCANCSAGKWSKTGNSSCTLNCGAGYYCANGIRTACPAGTYSTNATASTSATCTNCAEGKYSTTVAATAASTCLNCSAGKWGGEGRSTDCTDNCPGGYACVNGSKTQCAANTAASGGNSSCTGCSAGTYSSAGASSCSDCNKTDCASYSSYCDCSRCSTPNNYILQSGTCNARLVNSSTSKVVIRNITYLGTIEYFECERQCRAHYWEGVCADILPIMKWTAGGTMCASGVDASDDSCVLRGTQTYGARVIGNQGHLYKVYKDQSGSLRYKELDAQIDICLCGQWYDAESNTIRRYGYGDW